MQQTQQEQQFVAAKRWPIGSVLLSGLCLSSMLLGSVLTKHFALVETITTKQQNSNLPTNITKSQWLLSPIFPTPPNAYFKRALTLDAKTHGYLASSWSETAYLDHCNFQHVNWSDVSNFISTAMPRNFSLTRNQGASQFSVRDLKQEMKLELLEIYASNHSKLCDFSNYHPTVREEANPEEAAAILKRVPHHDKNLIRLAIAIVAYKDIEHLQLLIQAVHLPHHYIIIHLERRANQTFEQGVRALALEYDNIVILKFGSIVYRTGQVTDINLRIMRWLVFDSGLSFSYFLTLGGATYPLYSARDLTLALKASGRKAFLGTIANAFALRISKKLYSTVALTYSRESAKLFPLRVSMSRDDLQLPMRPSLMELFDKKTNSGNQAIFDYHTVISLLQSVDAMEIFATSKYACCCCLEEIVWYGAMNAIGLAKEALATGSMMQFWSGLPKCVYTMSNAVLKVNSSACYTLGDRNARIRWNISRIEGPRLQDYLVKAKKVGFLFARKFDSTDPGSAKLRRWVGKYLHPKQIGPYLNPTVIINNNFMGK